MDIPEIFMGNKIEVRRRLSIIYNRLLTVSLENQFQHITKIATSDFPKLKIHPWQTVVVEKGGGFWLSELDTLFMSPLLYKHIIAKISLRRDTDFLWVTQQNPVDLCHEYVLHMEDDEYWARVILKWEQEEKAAKLDTIQYHKKQAQEEIDWYGSELLKRGQT